MLRSLGLLSLVGVATAGAGRTPLEADLGDAPLDTRRRRRGDRRCRGPGAAERGETRKEVGARRRRQADERSECTVAAQASTRRHFPPEEEGICGGVGRRGRRRRLGQRSRLPSLSRGSTVMSSGGSPGVVRKGWAGTWASTPKSAFRKRGRLGNRGRELVREGAAPYVDDAARPGRPALALAGVM